MPESPAAPIRRRGLLALAAGLGTGWLGGGAGVVLAQGNGAAVADWPAGRATPALSLAGLDGNARDLTQARGHPLLLNFWASWCEPCRDEMPSLELAAERHRADGLQVWLVNYAEHVRTVRGFVERLDIGLPVLLDTDGRATAAWTRRVFPTTVLVGADGRPWRSVTGGVDWGGPQARAWLQALVARRR